MAAGPTVPTVAESLQTSNENAWGVHAPFLAAVPEITPIQDLITTWTAIAQALVASIGALALLLPVGDKRMATTIG